MRKKTICYNKVGKKSIKLEKNRKGKTEGLNKMTGEKALQSEEEQERITGRKDRQQISARADQPRAITWWVPFFLLHGYVEKIYGFTGW